MNLDLGQTPLWKKKSFTSYKIMCVNSKNFIFIVFFAQLSLSVYIHEQASILKGVGCFNFCIFENQMKTVKLDQLSWFLDIFFYLRKSNVKKFGIL